MKRMMVSAVVGAAAAVAVPKDATMRGPSRTMRRQRRNFRLVRQQKAEESDEEDSDEQQGLAARPDQAANDERRPRRRGRRGGRRRRGGGPDEGLAASISDELGPTSEPEVSEAVADFDGGSPVEPASASLPDVQPETIAPAAEPQPAMQAEAEPVHSAISRSRTRRREGGAAAVDRARKGELPDQRLLRQQLRSKPSCLSRRRPIRHRLPRQRRRRLRARPAGGRAASAGG